MKEMRFTAFLRRNAPPEMRNPVGVAFQASRGVRIAV